MFAHEGVFPPLQGRWPDWCMPCGRRWPLSSTTCTVASINMMGCSPCSCANTGSKLLWAQCQQCGKPRHKPILAKKYIYKQFKNIKNVNNITISNDGIIQVLNNTETFTLDSIVKIKEYFYKNLIVLILNNLVHVLKKHNN